MAKEKTEEINNKVIESSQQKEELSLSKKIDTIYEAIENNPKKKGKDKKIKEFKIPSKGRISNSKMKQGFATIQIISENNEVSFEKQPIKGSVFKTSDGFYHATDKDSILTYKGKPFIIQSAIKTNPYNPKDKENEIFGQMPILAAMQTGAYTGEIKKKAGMGGITLIIIIAVVGYLAYNLITKGKIA